MVASDPRLEAIADDVRVADRAGRLDPQATAFRIDVPIRDADIGNLVEAVTVGGVIVLSQRLPSPGRRRFAFAHELGHLLIGRGAMPWVPRRNEEIWADWFAHELVFPRRWLRERRWRRLRLFDDPAERQTIGMHLASASHRHAVIRVDESVICGRCGDRSFFADCECSAYRTDREAFESLPWMLKPSDLDSNQLRLFDMADDPIETLWRHLMIHHDAGSATRRSFPDPVLYTPTTY